MDLVLGLDVGTTATKALVMDLDGNVVASATQSYGLMTPQEAWVEQDPEALWQAVVAVCRSVGRQLKPGDRVVALSQSSQGGTTIPADVQGTPIYNAISWMDQRSVDQSRQVREQWGGEFVYATTGWPLSDGLPLQHIAWLRQNRSELFAQTSYWLFVNDFIGYRLTGRRCMNPSDASITQLMDLATGDWDDRLLRTAGIVPQQLSPIHPSGHVVGTLTEEASQETGLEQDVLVVNGAHDQYCAAVGAGVTRPGPVLLSCGTAWVLLAVPDDLDAGLGSGMAISCHAVPGRWGAIRSLGGLGACLEWYLRRVWRNDESPGEGQDDYAALNIGAARSMAGAAGLFFCPMAGGHASTGTGRGAFSGLSLSHSRDDMARAVMEGIAYELRWAMEDMRVKGFQIAALKMVGGAAESPLWPQIVADVTGVPVTVPADKQAAGRGAAILAGVGAELFSDTDAGIAACRSEEKCLEASVENQQVYDRQFALYQELCTYLAGR